VLTTLLTAFILGLFAGLAPGPYTTMVVGTALERGMKPALKLAFTPLVTDVAPVLVTALVLERLSWPALTLLGLAGGVVIAMIGTRFLTRHAGTPVPRDAAVGEAASVAPAASNDTDQSARFGHVVLSSLLSPAPWLFWLVVGSPLLLRAWERSPTQGVLFLFVLFATNVGSASSLAWAASHGSRLMAPAHRRWVLRLVGVGLIGAGGFLVWQSMSGDFQSWVDSQNAVRSVVDPEAPDSPGGRR